MEWKRMDAYQTLVARLQEKYRARDGAVSALLDEGVPGKLLARARKMRRRLADNVHAGACCGNRRKSDSTAAAGWLRNRKRYHNR